MALPILAPGSDEALRDSVAGAVADGTRLAVRGRGTKRGLGRPVAADATLSLAGLTGITYFEPGELVMEARAGTPLAEIEAALAAHNQRLAFEPGEAGPPWGAAAAEEPLSIELAAPGAAAEPPSIELAARGAAAAEAGGTIGGIFAANISGPRRPFAGAARDHLLGFSAVSGRGESFAAGGRVVKNVTGYDMAKLLAGSFGTLAVFSSVTFKVLPRPEAERTVLLFGASPRAGVEALNRAAGGTRDITAGAHLPPEAAARSTVAYLRDAGVPVTALRLEGAHDAVAERCAALRAELAAGGTCDELHTHNSRRFWAEMADGRLLAPPHGAASLLWRLTLPPAHGAATAARLAAETEGEVVFDWAGGLIWLALDAGGEAHARAVRVAAAEAGGHAVLWRADDAIRARVAVFAPEVPARAALTARIKTNFDPRGVLNPGRMFEGL